MKRIIEIIRRLRKTENNAAFEFDNATFEFDYAHSTAVAASSMRWFRLRSTTATHEAPDYSEAGYFSVVERSRILFGG
jgi:hypothetical protein